MANCAEAMNIFKAAIFKPVCAVLLGFAWFGWTLGPWNCIDSGPR